MGGSRFFQLPREVTFSQAGLGIECLTMRSLGRLYGLNRAVGIAQDIFGELNPVLLVGETATLVLLTIHDVTCLLLQHQTRKKMLASTTLQSCVDTHSR